MENTKNIFNISPHISLSIEHNPHKLNYEKIDEYFRSLQLNITDHLSPDEYERCLLSDEIWMIQWYPDTPISFHWVFAPTFQECLAKANK